MKFSIRDFFSKCDQMRSFLCSDTHIPREHFFFSERIWIFGRGSGNLAIRR